MHLLIPCLAVLTGMHGILYNRQQCQNWTIRILNISSVNQYFVRAFFKFKELSLDHSGAFTYHEE